MRKNATDAENLLWQLLRNRQVAEAKFRRQHPFARYILDFYCHEAKLVIEVDGSGHLKQKQASYDAERTRVLESHGLHVLRFWNHEVLNQTEAVLEQIWWALNDALAPARSLSSLTGESAGDEENLIWYHALAIGYTPAYLSENAGGIRQDWPRIPLPAGREALLASAALGKRVAELLDTEALVDGVTQGSLLEGSKAVGTLAMIRGGQLRPEQGDLAHQLVALVLFQTELDENYRAVCSAPCIWPGVAGE